jgi:hypothetical protein
VRLLCAPLLLSPASDAFECVANNGRFLVGIGVGKIVSAGVDVGLSKAAREALNSLAERSIEQEMTGALRFVQVESLEHAAECTEKALLITDEGDLVFFLVADHACSEAVKGALHDLLSPLPPDRTCREHPGFG